MPALAECVALRFGGEDQALRALKDFKEMSLLDLAGFCALLDLDLSLLLGAEAAVLAHLLPGPVTMDSRLLLQSEPLEPLPEPSPDFAKLQQKWWLLGGYLGLLALRGISQEPRIPNRKCRRRGLAAAHRGAEEISGELFEALLYGSVSRGGVQGLRCKDSSRSHVSTSFSPDMLLFRPCRSLIYVYIYIYL